MKKFLTSEIYPFRTSINDTINIKIGSSHDFKTLSLAVLSRHGVVHIKTFENVKSGIDLSYDLQITKEMQPAANVIAFYVENGKFVYGFQKIEVNFEFRNQVSLIYWTKLLNPLIYSFR